MKEGISMAKFDHVNWEEERKQLTVHAMIAAKGFPRIFDMGVSVEDVVADVLLEFFKSPNGLGWDPKRGRLHAFLRKRVKQRLIDHIRRDAKIAKSVDDTSSTEEFLTPHVSPVGTTRCEYAEYRDQLLEIVGDDQDLRDLIEATQLVAGGANVNQQLSEILDRPVSEVVNLKRRLMNNPKVRECYGQRK